jgi:hypothetical protein
MSCFGVRRHVAAFPRRDRSRRFKARTCPRIPRRAIYLNKDLIIVSLIAEILKTEIQMPEGKSRNGEPFRLFVWKFGHHESTASSLVKPEFRRWPATVAATHGINFGSVFRHFKLAFSWNKC